MIEIKCSKADNTSRTWWLFLTMVVERTWVGIGTIGCRTNLGWNRNIWRQPWGPTTPLQLPLPSTWGLVPVHPISGGQAKFKYSYLLPPSEAPFKDKTVTELKCSKANNTLGLQLPLPLTEGLVPVHPISPTSLRSRGQAKFKYSYLLPPSEAPFKDTTVTELKCSKVDNTSGTWWLFLTRVAGRTWVRIGTFGAHRGDGQLPFNFPCPRLGGLFQYTN